jgi:EmrB/QacA subfamily drug resistance transporter
VLLLTGAALGDRFGRKRMFTIGLSAFTLASAAAALAPTTELLIAARAIQGAAAASVLPLTLTLLSEAFPAGRRGLVLGLWSGISGLAVAIGPLVGGAVVDGISWHWIFWINVPIGIALVPLAARFLTESHGPARHLDLPGLALGGIGLLGVVYGIVRGNDLGWTSTEILASLTVGAALVAAFIAWELRAPHPMLPMRFFRSRAFAAANGVGFFMSFGVFGSIFLLAPFLQVTQGLSPLEAGIRTLPWTAMPMLVAPIAGILSDRVGSRPLMALGLSLQAGSMAWLAAVSTATVAYSELVLPFIMAGAGMALVFAPSANAVLGSVRQVEAGQASGATNAIRELGGVMGVAVLASVFTTHGSYASPQAYTDGMIPAVWVGAALLAVGALVALLIPRKAGRATAAAPAIEVAPEPVAV